MRLLILLFVTLTAGCTLYTPRPTTFHFRDGDTGEPIPNVDVRAHYMAMLDFGVLFGSIGPMHGTTDGNGAMTLIIDADKHNFGIWIDSNDYSRFASSSNRLRKIASPWYRVGRHYEVLQYKYPWPEAVITVPAGYLGPLIVSFVGDEYPPLMNGRRSFEYAADGRGHVRVPDAAVFENRDVVQFSVRTADGTKHRFESGRKLWMTPEERAEVVLRLHDRHHRPHTWLFWLGDDHDHERVKEELHTKNSDIDEAAYQRLVGK